jgi:poly-beta-1,6-N-acetyl-D-glucosamine synthase
MIYFLQLIFFLFLFLLIHSYFLYPIAIKIISLFFRNFKYTRIIEPSISIIISAYNEERVIENRIENIASLNYNFNKIEVLIGSDNSADGTNGIILKLKEKYPWLNFYPFKERRGKVSVINDLVSKARNDILIFTDANVMFDERMLKNILPHFSDSKVGGVSGQIILSESKFIQSKDVEEQNYWSYENFIKRNEGRCGIQIGGNGGIYAIRRNLFEVIPDTHAVTDDLYVPLSILQKGYKYLFEDEAVAFEEISQNVYHEFKRKVRFFATNFQTIFYFKSLLFNKNLLISYALWSHKIIRWFTPFFLFVFFFLSIYLFNTANFFKWVLLVQILFYFLSIIGFLLMKKGLYIRIFSIPFYVGLVNLALCKGFLQFISNKHKGYWESTPR